MTSGERRETYLPTQQASACKKARISQADEDQGWSRRLEVTTLQGSRPFVGVIGRIPRRSGFSPFQRSRVVRDESLSLRIALDSAAGGVRVAFSTPRRIGSAVVRNRLRRQVRELIRARAARLPSGWYLIGVERGAVDKTWGQLGHALDQLLNQAQSLTAEHQKPNVHAQLEIL